MMTCFRHCIFACLLSALFWIPGDAPAKAASKPQNAIADPGDSCIEFIPGDAVDIGEEVILYGAGCAAFPGYQSAQYDWDFGDDLTFSAQGMSVSHFFMRPGTFTIRLGVTPGVQVSEYVWEWPPAGRLEYTGSIIVSGDSPVQPPMVAAVPRLELAFEDSIIDTSGNGIAVAWAEAPGGFTDGIVGRALDLTQGGYLRIANAGSLVGNLNEYTLSFWFKKVSAGSYGRILDQYDQEAQNQSGAGIRMRFGIDYANSGGFTPYYGGYLRTTAGLLPANYSANVGTDNTLWHHGAITYSAGTGLAHVYIDNQEIANSPFATSGPLSTSTAPLIIGAAYNGQAVFQGYLDELRIYAKALSQAELFDGVVVRHAPFEGRLAQYISVSMPEVFRDSPEKRLRAFVTGGALGSGESTLADRTHLLAQETFLLRNTDLPGSPDAYRLVVQLLDGSGTVQYQESERFTKSYDGAPAFGIDENNTFRLNGQPFFPVTSYGLNNNDVDDWAGAGYINSLTGQGFWGTYGAPSFTISGFEEYLDIANTNGIGVLGPHTRWDGMGTYTGNLTNRADLHKMRDYILALKSHPALYVWDWLDEPDIWGTEGPTVRAWTSYTHRLDDTRPVITGFGGFMYSSCASSYRHTQRRQYSYENNIRYFGRRTAVADIIAFDIYPIDAVTSGVTFDCYLSAIDNLHRENGDLLPIVSANETSNATGNGTDGGASPWLVSAEQIRMTAWLDVVREIKGIIWFHYFGATPAENLAEMARFERQIGMLAPAVLGPRTSYRVAVATNAPARIETMIREHDGALYLIAVRVSDVEDHANAQNRVDPIDKYDVTTQFALPGIRSGVVEVFEESRSLSFANGFFSDTFAPFAVHIYRLTSLTPFDYSIQLPLVRR